MTATITQDEDLIILGEETSSNDIFNFETTWLSTQEEIVTDMIDFSSEEPSVTTVWESSTDFSFSFSNEDLQVSDSETSTLETEVVENALSDKNEVDFWFISDDISSQKIEETIQDEVVDSVHTNFSFDVSQPEVALESNVSEVSFAETTSDISFDMNSILDQTILQLESRKSEITNQKSQKSTQVGDLLAQIAALQHQVNGLNTEIDELEIENKKIDKNIAGIQKMKHETLDISEVTERQRKHAPEKIKAKK